MLKFSGAWRFEPPPDGSFHNRAIPHEAVGELFSLIGRVATQGKRQDILEHFKGYFCGAVGTTHVWSSSTSWAETDLENYMSQAAKNAPLFIEAFFDACDSFRGKGLGDFAPDAPMINKVLSKHSVGYEVAPPNLVLRETVAPLVEVPERPPTLAEQAVEVFQGSLRSSQRFLSEGNGRAAVQEILWLLESVATAFRGVDTGTKTIEGKFFNRIARELQQSSKDKTLDRIVAWMTSLHGYLSSPTGGGVRHGLDLNEGVVMDLNEARLFCNLVRSYLVFLLAEHERLTSGRTGRS